MKIKKEITLREHLSNIALKRQNDLKKSLGKKGYSEYMAQISHKRKSAKKENTMTQNKLAIQHAR